MGWIPGFTHENGPYPQGPLKPSAVILHRTFGRFPGDIAVARGARSGIGFHFLIPCNKTDGAYQFYDTNTRCSHAKGANDWAIGIEFEGINNDAPLTGWQVEKGRELIRWLAATHHIPLALYDGVRCGKTSHFRGHNTVVGSDHDDFVTKSDWQKLIDGDDDMTDDDRKRAEQTGQRVANLENVTSTFIVPTLQKIERLLPALEKLATQK